MSDVKLFPSFFIKRRKKTRFSDEITWPRVYNNTGEGK